MIRVVCAWCKRPMGEIESRPEENGLVSHSICPPCLATHFPDRAGAFLHTVPGAKAGQSDGPRP